MDEMLQGANSLLTDLEVMFEKRKQLFLDIEGLPSHEANIIYSVFNGIKTDMNSARKELLQLALEE